MAAACLVKCIAALWIELHNTAERYLQRTCCLYSQNAAIVKPQSGQNADAIKDMFGCREHCAEPYSACRPIGVAPLKVAPKSARYVSNTGLVGLVEVVGL